MMDEGQPLRMILEDGWRMALRMDGGTLRMRPSLRVPPCPSHEGGTSAGCDVRTNAADVLCKDLAHMVAVP